MLPRRLRNPALTATLRDLLYIQAIPLLLYPVEMSEEIIPEITTSLVTKLIAEQFPQWSSLPVKPVKQSGFDNVTFHLGDEFSVRLPRLKSFSTQPLREHQWLHKLAPHLSVQIPEVIALGRPSAEYPWHWSVSRWIEGNAFNSFTRSELQQFAVPLAEFLKELHAIDGAGGLEPGEENFFHGLSPKANDAKVQEAFKKIDRYIDINAAKELWSRAVNSQIAKRPVWFHGDMNTGNFILKDGKLVAVIDFGTMGVGDPACDLKIAWSLFDQPARKLFKNHLGYDADMWDRAKGWALYNNSIYGLAFNENISPEGIQICQKIAAKIFED